MSLVGLVCLSLLIWFVGPLISIGQYQPLAAYWSRLLVISLCTLLVFAPILLTWLKQRKNRVILEEGLTEKDERGREQNSRIEETFTNALQTLNKSKKRKSFWSFKQHLYDLPWYIIIGPPGSGKTTALRKSGLHFPLQDSSEGHSIKGIGGTRHCDWWFTDEAVLIDTAGRFSTQDSHQATDAQAWKKFLQLLKKTRPKQPVNGVLLTVSVEDLLGSAARLNDLANKLRKRLQELTDEFGVQLPIYLLITKLDLLTGFSETFTSFSPDEIKEGLGFTLNDNASTPQSERLAKIQSEFLKLQSRLQQQIHSSLEQEPSSDRRKLIFEFVHQIGALYLPLQNCLKTIFEGEGRFFSANRLRGFYLTSGTQQGTSLARLNAKMNASMRMNYSKHHSRAYFIERVMREVVFRECDLVGLVKKRVLAEKILKIGTSAITATAMMVLCVGWWVSYTNNISTLEQVELSSQLAHKATQKKGDDGTSIDATTLDQLNRIRTLAPLSELNSQNLGWEHNLGLNQYQKVSFAQERSYRKAADRLLVPRINQRLEFQLAEHAGKDLEVTYEVLKVYLMLHQPQYRDIQAIKDWVLYDWRLNQLSHLSNQQQSEALDHLEFALLNTNLDALPPAQNHLIKTAREALAGVSIEERLLRKLKRLFEASQSKPFNVLEKAGGDLSSLFVRESKQSLAAGPNAFYTKEAYTGFFYPRLLKETEGLLTESSWVLGSLAPRNKLSGIQIQQQVRQEYVRAYIQAWQNFLSDIRIRKAASLDQALELSRLLAKDRSPMERFMKTVAEQTRLGGPLETLTKNANEKGERIVQSKTPSQLDFLNQREGSNDLSPTIPELQVDQHFRPIIELFDADAGGYAEVSNLLSQLYNLLSALETAQKEQSIPPSSSEFNAIAAQAGLLPEPIQSTIRRLANQAGQQTQQTQRENLTAEMRPLRDLCRASIEGRYPFKSNAKLEVLPLDFARVFGPNGIMAQHFDSHLANMVDKGAGSWRFKAKGNASASQSSALIQFQRAYEIQQVFFDGKPRPTFGFKMTLIGSSNPSDTFYMQYGGKLSMFSMDYEPSHNLVWPALGADSKLEIRSSEDSKSTSYNGYWGLFRMFDNSQRRTGAGPEEFISRITLGDQWFDFRITVASALNPLSLRALKRFGCPGGL